MKSLKITLFYRFILVIIALIGVSLSVFFQGKDNPLGMFVYFTIQSNLLVIIVYGILCWKGYQKFRSEQQITLHPMIQLGTLFTILITFLVYAFLLSSIRFDMGGTRSMMSTIINIIVHYLVPILCIIDYLLFYPKGKTKYRYAIYWLSIPFVYFLFTIIRAQIGGVLYTIQYGPIEHQTYYPYPFIDLDYLGIAKTTLNAAFLLIGFLLLGLILIKIDHFLIKKKAN